ncbi:aquaporin-like protein [Cantharellus anzutake]|uniref:aquaporin-like protein n=1 Tax=Cantharellus anzutake TaxID=1750568 RepID=UPI001906705D|nr:aquaporin-like protein [Cantharellus anzutake]KAF8337482.1 aquaporin-like protein [Cantharellus anzutake]
MALRSSSRSPKAWVDPPSDEGPERLAVAECVTTSEACCNGYPNKYASFRNRYLREFASEFIGTMIMIIFGLGANLQVVLSSSPLVAADQKGSYLSRSIAMAAGVSMGAWAAGATGGHINPVVTLVQAILRGLPWRKVPVYIAAQLLGAITGALLLYANYYHAIDLYEGGRGVRSISTASLLTTYALDYMPNAACFFSDGPPPKGLVPLGLFFMIFCEGASLGMETSYGLNPARDLGPQILWNYRHQYWFWVPTLGPVCGGIIGGIIYDALIFTGDESIFNRSYVLL